MNNRISKTNVLLVVFLIQFLFCASLGAQKEYNQEINVSTQFDLAVSENKNLSPKQALSLNYEKNTSQSIFHEGIKQDTWLKISSNNIDAHFGFLKFTNPLVDQLDFYVFKNMKLIDSSKTGQHVYMKDRAYPFSSLLIELPSDPSSNNIYLIRLRKLNQVRTEIHASPPKQTLVNAAANDRIFSLYYGILLFVSFMSLITFFATKDYSFLAYSCYIFMFSLTQIMLQGLGGIYLIEHPLIHIYGEVILGKTTVISLTIFTQIFLKTKQNIHWAHQIFNFFNLLFTTLIISYLFVDDMFIVIRLYEVSILLYIIVALTAIIALSLKGNIEAKYMLFACISVMFGATVVILKEWGILQESILTNLTLPLGVLLELFILCIGLIRKNQAISREKDKNRLEILRVLKEKEKIVTEHNSKLEQKVEERTLDLIRSNDELRRSIQELKDARLRLVNIEKMASLGQLTAGIAHEINNPINFISSNISPLKRDIQDVLDYVEYLEQSLEGGQVSAATEKKQELDLNYSLEELEAILNGLREGANRTIEILKGLRNFSRRDDVDLKKADINEGIESTLIVLKNKYKSLIDIEKNYGTILPINCLPGKLNQVFLNIINNAIDALLELPESQQKKISISTSSKSEILLVEISDNGPGIPEEVISKIFDPFFTTKEVGKGTGLGLALCREIILQHKGKLEVESWPNKGTNFKVFIPMNLKKLVKVNDSNSSSEVSQ